MSKATGRAYYDRRADVLSIDIRDGGEPRHVVVGRGTFVVYADDAGIYSIEIEAESWDTDIDIDKLMELMKVEIL
jgi:uncharacterized protein YuzE